MVSENCQAGDALLAQIGLHCGPFPVTVRGTLLSNLIRSALLIDTITSLLLIVSSVSVLLMHIVPGGGLWETPWRALWLSRIGQTLGMELLAQREVSWVSHRSVMLPGLCACLLICGYFLLTWPSTAWFWDSKWILTAPSRVQSSLPSPLLARWHSSSGTFSPFSFYKVLLYIPG